MKLEIYRKHDVFGYTFVDDKPETVFSNISWIELKGKHICGNIGGEELTISVDNWNYDYRIIAE